MIVLMATHTRRGEDTALYLNLEPDCRQSTYWQPNNRRKFSSIDAANLSGAILR